jgi:hypothetical protein
MLKAFMNEIRTGRRESSVLSIVSTGSLSESEKLEWRQLRKELQSIGITPEIFSLNRDFIHTTLRALSQGEFGNLDNLPTIDEDVSSPAGFFSPGPNTPEISFTPRPSSQDDYPSSQDPMSLPKPTPSIYYQHQKNQRTSDVLAAHPRSQLFPMVSNRGKDLYLNYGFHARPPSEAPGAILGIQPLSLSQSAPPPKASQMSLDELDKAKMANGERTNSLALMMVK